MVLTACITGAMHYIESMKETNNNLNKENKMRNTPQIKEIHVNFQKNVNVHISYEKMGFVFSNSYTYKEFYALELPSFYINLGYDSARNEKRANDLKKAGYALCNTDAEITSSYQSYPVLAILDKQFAEV